MFCELAGDFGYSDIGTNKLKIRNNIKHLRESRRISKSFSYKMWKKSALRRRLFDERSEELSPLDVFFPFCRKNLRAAKAAFFCFVFFAAAKKMKKSIIPIINILGLLDGYVDKELYLYHLLRHPATLLLWLV